MSPTSENEPLAHHARDTRVVGHFAQLRGHWAYLVPALPRSVGLGPVSSPPRLARTEQLSTTTSQGALSGPARTIRIRATWTWRNRAVALQPSRRRRRVEPQARPLRR